MMPLHERFLFSVQSVTDAARVFTGEGYRLSLLSPCLLRVEVGKADGFTDEPTQKVWFRNFDAPACKATWSGPVLSLHTTRAIFRFDTREKRLVRVSLRDGREVEQFGRGNLRGTARTLDGTQGPVPLEDGVCSRAGVAVLDDGDSLLLKPDGRILPRAGAESDLYYFAHGYDYRGAVRDLFRLTGPVPLVPRFALGNWWSRYKAYTQAEYTALMQRFLDEQIPITVATVDMDWHWVDVVKRFGPSAKNQCPPAVPNWFEMTPGWTGYSWNTELFPDYPGFLRWLKAQGFHVTLNLHPATGVRWFEDMYPQMAKALGVDPATKRQIRFDITDPDFINAYFDILHHPYEKQGVDFWWIDWQQGKNSGLPGLDPLWALNHYHYLDSAREEKRGLILSRYAKLGSHRYPLGFSGDTAQTWRVLDFQPYFTATASNAGYTWWSHDIGGHHQGERDDELYLRWVQFGVCNPIMRLHSTSNELFGKEPWKYRWDVARLATEYLRLRHRLIPYLYTMNARTHREGRALMEPMYYEYPRRDEAYTVGNEYLFGSELIAAPITQPVNRATNLAHVRVWLPEGRYTDVLSGRIYQGGGYIDMYRGLEGFPLLAKEGAILPLDADGLHNDWRNPKELTVLVYRGDSTFRLYEDDGETKAFEQGAYAYTPMTVREENGRVVFTVDPAEGDVSVLPAGRSFTIVFQDITACQACHVTRGGIEIDSSEETKGERGLSLTIEQAGPEQRLEIILDGVTVCQNEPVREQVIRFLSGIQGNNLWKTRKFSRFLSEKRGGRSRLRGLSPVYAGPLREIYGLWREEDADTSQK